MRRNLNFHAADFWVSQGSDSEGPPEASQWMVKYLNIQKCIEIDGNMYVAQQVTISG